MTGFPGFPGRRKQDRQAARGLYASLLKAALAPRLYEVGAAVDSFEGRAAMVTAHASLLIHRLNAIPDARAPRLAKAVNALILDGFDAAFREKGVGDSSIARKVRKLAEQHSGLGRALLEALGPGDADDGEELTALLKRNGVTQPGQETRLAIHIRETAAALSGLPDATILTGEFDWPGLN